VRPPTSGERIACAEITAHDRFEGEHPAALWPRGRAAQVLLTGYAPSKYRTKPWPSEALLSFTIVPPLLALLRGDPELPLPSRELPVSRDRLPRSAVAVNANEPPGVKGKDAGDEDGSALDAAFPRSVWHRLGRKIEKGDQLGY